MVRLRCPVECATVHCRVVSCALHRGAEMRIGESWQLRDVCLRLRVTQTADPDPLYSRNS